MKGIRVCNGCINILHEKGGDIPMMEHGKHCDCMMCSMGKNIGIKKCSDEHCADPSHSHKTKQYPNSIPKKGDETYE
jgi:hypothetical protein